MKKTYKTLKFIFKKKSKNIILIIFIIIVWLISRKTEIIPYIIWDILRWMMMFLIVNLFSKNIIFTAIVSLLICFWIEFFQLIDYQLLHQIRETKIWWLVLWRWFLYTDLVAYSIWVWSITLSYLILKK